MSTLYVDNLQPNLGSQVEIPQLKPLAGSVVQVESYRFTSSWSTTSTSFVDVTDFNVSITPTSLSSKILVVCNLDAFHSLTALQDEYRILRSIGGGAYADPASISGGRFWFSSGYYGSGTTGAAATNYLDSPATTSLITYKLQARTRHSGNSFSIGTDWNGESPSGMHSLTLMEIAQ